MKKIMNLILNVPVLGLSVMLLFKYWNLYSAFAVLIFSVIMILQTVSEEKKPIQVLPITLFWGIMSLIAIWMPMLILYKNPEPVDFKLVIDGIMMDPQNRAVPLFIAVGVAIFLGVISKVVSQRYISDVFKIISCNAFCLAVIDMLYKNTHLQKFSVMICVFTVAYVMLFESHLRPGRFAMNLMTVVLNAVGVFLYWVSSGYIEYFFHFYMPAITGFLSGWKFFLILLGLALFFVLTSITKKTPLRTKATNSDMVENSSVTFLMLILSYKFASFVFTDVIYLYILFAIFLIVNIVCRNYNSGKLLADKTYILCEIATAVVVLFVSLYLEKPDVAMYFFGNYYFFAAVGVLLVTALILMMFAKHWLGFAALGVAGVIASVCYCFNIYNIILAACITLLGLYMIAKVNKNKVYLCSVVLVLAVIANYLSVTGVKVGIWSDGEIVCGSETLDNSLLYIQQKNGIADTENMTVKWDGEDENVVCGFSKTYTKVRNGGLTVTTTSKNGITKKQNFDFVTEGVWQLADGSYAEPGMTVNPMKIVEYKKENLKDGATPLSCGYFVDDGNMYFFGNDISLCTVNGAPVKAVAYVMLDDEDNVIGKGYAANSSFVDVLIPEKEKAKRVLAYVIDGRFSVSDMTEWSVVYPE